MGLLSRRPSTPVGPFAELSKHSRFAYIEKLEFWPELDDDGRAWTSRESYPGDPSGCIRGESGERVTLPVTPGRISFDRATGYSLWVDEVRWDGAEYHEVNWIGSSGAGSTRLAGSPVGSDLSPDGQWIAHMTWENGADLFRISTATGEVHHYSHFDSGITGGEPLHWSPDSSYVLISRGGNDHKSWILNSQTGTIGELPRTGMAAWWPARGPSSVLITHSDGGPSTMVAADLATLDMEVIGDVGYPDQLPRHDGSTFVHAATVSPDGSTFLALAFFGSHSITGVERGIKLGGRAKWVTGALPVAGDSNPPAITAWSPDWCWFGVPALELDQRKPTWLEQPSSEPIYIHTSMT